MLTKKDRSLENQARKLIGQLGEQLAADYLVNKGMRIMYRNYFSKRGEIDLVVTDRGVLVFVEVRTRSTDSFLHPFETISVAKQQKVRRAAVDYLSEYGTPKINGCRFDAISVVMREGEEAQIEYVVSAFNGGDQYGI
ncbi:MAG: putative endonuclease [Candidatus Omnitrophota bacterium]|jgi:putative endonuclease